MNKVAEEEFFSQDRDSCVIASFNKYFLYVKCTSCFQSSLLISFMSVTECITVWNSYMLWFACFFKHLSSFLLKSGGIHLSGAPCDGMFSLVP